MKKEESFQFLVLGIGDFFSKYYYNTSVVVIAEGKKLLIDFPAPLRKVLYEASLSSNLKLDIEDIDHAILTHVHSDHSNGLETFAFHKLFIQKQVSKLYTISEVKDVLWENRLKASMGALTDENFVKIKDMTLEDYFDVTILEEGKINTIGPFNVEIRRTHHFVPCFGIKISYNGKVLGISGDTSFDPEHIKFLSNADIIIHEACGEGHTPYDKLLTLPDEIKQKMMIIHIQDEFNIEKSLIKVAEQGKIYSLFD